MDDVIYSKINVINYFYLYFKPSLSHGFHSCCRTMILLNPFLSSELAHEIADEI